MTRAHRPVSRIVVVAATLALIAAFVPPDLSLTQDEAPGGATVGADLAEHLAVAPDDERIEVIVSFHQREDLGLLERIDAPQRALRALPMAGAHLSPAEIDEVASWPEVRGVHANLELEYFNHQSVPMSGAPQVWQDLGYTGQGVTVAIHDTGIDGTHPDASYPDKTIQNIKILHTRFVDFAHGVDNPTPTGTVEDQTHTDTTSGHGTHVAGTAAGSGDIDPDYRGMAPDASVVGIGAGDVLFVYAALEGYDWLFVEEDGVPNHERYDIRVINNSWGTTNNHELDVDNPIVQAIFAAYEAGITPVFSAGNSGPGADTLNFYAQAPWVVGVGALDKELEIAGFSSRGYPNHPFKTPDVSGIGVSVESANYTAWPVLPYASASGTSMSAPHVTGLVALMLDANPDLSPDQVQHILRQTTAPLDGLETWEAGTGFIDAVAAVRAAEDAEGELDAFLAGGNAHTLEATAAMLDPESDDFALPYVRDEERWEGTVGPALLWAGINDTHEFEVPEGTEFLNARIAWDRTPETLDLFLTDEEGQQYSAVSDVLDYGLGSSKILRIRNPLPGDWTVEVRGEVSVATEYTGLIASYVVDEPNWPGPDDEEQTAEISPDSFFKFTPYALGIASTYFMTGDSGFYTFHVRDSDGNVIDDAEVDVVMIDRIGEEALRQRAIQRDDGSYQISDIAFDHTWEGEPGRYRVTFEHHSGIDEDLAIRDGAFHLNHLDIAASAVDADGLRQSSVEPGETVTIEGDLQRVNERVEVIRLEPMTGADVAAALIDGDGGVLDEAVVTTDPLDGTFTAELTVPEDATSLLGVVLEAEYDELAFVIGPGYWYGTEQIALELEDAETIATGVSLDVNPETVSGSQRTVELAAGATHSGGTDAIEQLELVLRGSNGRTVETWELDAFTEESDGVLGLEEAYRLRGPAPWTFHLVMVDGDGESHEVERTVRHGGGAPQ